MIKAEDARLGIIDWGIGGLGAVRELRALYTHKKADLPAISYLSDTGATPYGTLSARDLEARLRRAIGFLRDRGASKILLACNAASTALPRLSDLDDVSGVIAPTLELISKRRASKRIVIIGGRRTIRSRVYSRALTARGFRVVQRIAQPLSGMIERGEQHTPRFEATVTELLRGVTHYNALVLACTHYPAALPIFEKHFPGAVIDPLRAIARSLGSLGKLNSSQKQPEFLTTGDPRAMARAAHKAWGDAFAHLHPRKINL